MKKLLCVLLALAMVATTFVATVTLVSAGGSSVGKVEEGYTPAEGSIAVSTPEEFAAMEAGKNYHLTADIAISKTWNAGADVTANTGNTVFTGTFDGNGHKVTVSAPMFAQIGGTVKNLTIEGKIDSTLYSAAVSMYCKGTATFENICNRADIKGANAGSLIAYSATGSTITAKNCLNEGEIISVSGQAGGLFGYVQDDKLTVENCINTGNVSAQASYSGGIIGRFGRDKAAAPDSVIVIDNCDNYGKITSSKDQAGGIMGLFVGDATVTNCNNYGEIINPNGMAAGIIGTHYNPKDVADHSGLVLENCVNHGKVTGTTVVAGIIARHGRIAPNPNLTYRMKNCENHGDIYANITSTTDTYYVGGLVGYAYGGTTYGDGLPNAIINCINTGDIYVDASTSTYAHHVSGLLGYVNSNLYEFKNNVNLGKINLASELVSGSMCSLTIYNKNATSTGTANNYSVDEFYIAGVKTDVNNAMIGSADNTEKAKITTLEQAASGELAYLVNQGAGTNVFFQNLKEDAFPTVFAAEDGSNVVIKNGDAYVNPTTDFSALNALIESASALEEKNYTANWAEFASALASAKEVVANALSTQKAVDDAAKALDDAMKALVTKKFAKIGEVEYASLEAAIAAAQAGDTIVLIDNIIADAAVSVTKSVTIDGNGKTITADGVNAVEVDGEKLDVTIKNLKIATDKTGLTLVSCASAEGRSKLTIADVEINSTAATAMVAEMYWDFDMDRCTLTGNYALHCSKDNSANVITIDDSVLTGNTTYAAYFRSASTITITNSTITGKQTKLTSEGTSKPNATVQIKTSTAETQTSLTLNNCNVTSFGGYVVAVNPFNNVYINGGNYKTETPAGCNTNDALINVGNKNAYCKITGGTFTAKTNCAARVYGENSVLDIEGGTFIYDNANGGGSAVRAGTETAFGTVNIKGGHFMSNGTGPVINYVHKDATINITGGTFENNGENDIKIVTQLFGSTETTGRDVSFPAGLKEVAYNNGEYVDPDTIQPEDTTVPTPEDTTVPTPEDTTVPTPEETTPEETTPVVTPEETTPVVTPEETTPVVTPEETTPVVTPEETTPVVTPEETTPVVTPEETTPVVTPEETTPVVTPEDTTVPTTEEPDTPVVGDSIGTILIIAIASVVALGCVSAFVFIKKKENN